MENRRGFLGVCTENLNPNVVVMKSIGPREWHIGWGSDAYLTAFAPIDRDALSILSDPRSLRIRLALGHTKCPRSAKQPNII